MLEATKAPQFTPIEVLQAGDVLLMLGDGPLSAMIAWCGDSIYSHAAIVADDGNLIEAAPSGVRAVPIARRIGEVKHYYFIDAFRTLSHDGQPLTDTDQAAIVAHAKSLIGTPYPVNSLFMLGLLSAVRGKVPQDPRARLVVREALDLLVRDDASQMVCSEMVYRALAECDVTPPGRLAPEIVITPPTHLPFPQIDWLALWEELWPLLHPDSKLKAMQSVFQPVNGLLVDSPPVEHVGDEELQARMAQARAALGIDATAVRASDHGNAMLMGPLVLDVPHPNPKLVMPQDLASTPDHVPLGRLMQVDGVIG